MLSVEMLFDLFDFLSMPLTDRTCQRKRQFLSLMPSEVARLSPQSLVLEVKIGNQNRELPNANK